MSLELEWVLSRTREALAAVRTGEPARLAPLHDGMAFDLVAVDENSLVDTQGATVCIQMFVFDAGDRVRDIKEQQIFLVPAVTEDLVRIGAYLDGWARAVSTFAREFDVEVAMPHDFVVAKVLTDERVNTVAEFEEAILARLRTKRAPPVLGDVSDLEGTAPVAENPALERNIEDDPDRLAAWLVYADWLTERNDPRGELIVCQAPDAGAAGSFRAEDLLASHRKYFTGNLPLDTDDEDTDPHYLPVTLTWRLGYVDTARFASSWERENESPKFAARAMAALLRMPSGKFLRGLTLGVFTFDGNHDYDALYEVLADASPRPTLRSLFVGDLTSEEQEVSWVAGGHLARLATFCPKLTDLKVRAGSMFLENALTHWSALESLVLESGGLSKDTVTRVAAASLPAAKHLELWTGSTSYGGDSGIDDVMPILVGDNLPRLRSLAIRNCEYVDDVARALTRAPIVSQLERLDLSKGILSDEGAIALAGAKDRLGHLRELDVSSNYLTPEGTDALATLGIPIVAKDQREGAGEDRYVSLGE